MTKGALPGRVQAVVRPRPLPCPFCGSDPWVELYGNPRGECRIGCHCRIGPYTPTMHNRRAAIELWNKRPNAESGGRHG